MKFGIFDWGMNRLFSDKTFATFAEAWDFIRANVKDENNAYDDYFVFDLDEMREWGVGQ